MRIVTSKLRVDTDPETKPVHLSNRLRLTERLA